MKLMVRVLEEIDVPRPQQIVLLSMAENARDDGSKCYPSVDLIAWKAGYKPRAVIDIIRDLRKLGILEVVQEAAGQRPTEYQIHLDKAPRKLSFEEWQMQHGRHAERAKREVSLARENAPLNQLLSGENAPLDEGQGCNLTVVGVQSHVITPPLARENAPEPVIEPVKNQSMEVKPAVKGDTPAHRIVNEFYRLIGTASPAPAKDIGHGKSLANAGVTPADLPDMIAWAKNDWTGRGGFDLATLVRGVTRWRTAKAEAAAPKVRRYVV